MVSSLPAAGTGRNVRLWRDGASVRARFYPLGTMAGRAGDGAETCRGRDGCDDGDGCDDRDGPVRPRRAGLTAGRAICGTEK